MHALPAAALPISKYHQVYLVLLEQLREGRFEAGLPGELELARQFGVGRVTVRRALEQLTQEGRIVREVGRGTRPVVTRGRGGNGTGAEPLSPAGAPLKGLLANIVSVSRGTVVKVIEWKLIPASPELAVALGMAEGEPVRKGVRRRSSRAGPVSHITTYVPESLVRGVGRAELARKPILQLLQESGVEPGRAVQTVSARHADARVAAELDVSVGAALLWVRRLVYDTHERPVQLLHGLYRPDRYEYQMELNEVGGVQARIVAKEILS